MRNWFRSPLQIDLARERIRLLASGRLLADIALEQDALAAPAQAMAQLQSAIATAGVAGRRAGIVLDDRLVRYFTVTPPRNAAGMRDCRAAAAMRFQLLFGEAVAGWRVQADWQASRPFLASALPAALADALEHCAEVQCLTLVTAVPRFVTDWNRWRHAVKPDAWFGAVRATELVLGAVDRARLCEVRIVQLPAAPDADWLATLLAREALRQNRPPPARIQLAGPRSMPEAPGCEWLDDAAATGPKQ